MGGSLELGGKYLSMWVTHRELYYMLGTESDDATQGRDFLILGRIIGETPSVGLWVEVESFMNWKTEEAVLPEVVESKPTILVRWEMMQNARISDKKETRERIVGFRPKSKH